MAQEKQTESSNPTPTEVSELERHRTALVGQCYRMLGSACDAEDAAQETIIRAWRGLDGFDGRSAVRTWLYSIATNVCLDMLATRKRRERPFEAGPMGTEDGSHRDPKVIRNDER